MGTPYPSEPPRSLAERVSKRTLTAKLILEFFGALLTTITWIAICIVVVSITWYRYDARRDDAVSLWGLKIAEHLHLTYWVMTAFAVTTAVIVAGAMLRITTVLVREMARGREALAIPLTFVAGALILGALLFVTMTVATIVLPILTAMNLVPTPYGGPPA